MKTIIIKITRAGTRVGPFDVYDQLGNVIELGISRASLIDGEAFIVEDSVTAIKLVSNGKCSDELTKRIGVVAPYQLVEESVVTNTACLWKHLIPNIFNSYYGHTEPYILEYPVAYPVQDQILQSIKDYTKAFKYFPDGTDIFNPSLKIETDDEYFNELVVYNGQQSSGLLELVPKPKNNLRLYSSYPLYRNDRKIITFTKSDNFYNINNFWDIVKSKTSLLFIPTCETLSIDKIINQDNMDYTYRSFRKAPLRAKDVKFRYSLTNKSDVHLVSQIVFSQSQISYK